MIGAIRRGWAADTSASPELWTPENPALGQCAVTALVIQDILGGHLMRGTVFGESHYWNWLPNETELDLTLEQFEPDEFGIYRETMGFRDRDYVLSFPATVSRYEILKMRVRRALGG